MTYIFTIREFRLKREAVEAQMRRIAENIATMQLLDRQDWTVYRNDIKQLMEFNENIVYVAVYDDRNLLRACALNSERIENPGGNIPRWMEAEIVKKPDSGAIARKSREDLKTRQVKIQTGNRIPGNVHAGFPLIQINVEMQHAIWLNIGLAIFFFIIPDRRIRIHEW
ncbi:MAG: hypothetical protein EH225_07015 [Calditrichaeota bacterium]|nr:hypothetical protein [Calditrichota bacterium]RQW03523.1 MAG: hypothetical protein EH225_07015 [Calditrichota bacterium]